MSESPAIGSGAIVGGGSSHVTSECFRCGVAMTELAAPLTVGTLNVCGLVPRPPLRRLALRVPELCRQLATSGIDVLNLQEVFTRGSLQMLRDHMPFYPYVAFRQGPLGPAGGLVTFSRLPLGRPSYRSFLGARPTRGGLVFRLGHAAVSAMKGVLIVDVSGTPVTVVNTHLSANHDGDFSVDSRYHDLQRAELDRLNAAIRRADSKALMVITGDFNTASVSAHYPLITDHGARRDPFAATNPTTYHALFLPPGATRYRIDYVLVAGDEERYPVLDAATLFAGPVTVDATESYLSDHVGLTVQIGIS